MIDEPELVGKILFDTPYDSYALIKLQVPADTNFWFNAEVRGATQAYLDLATPWAKIKKVLNDHGVDTAEKFDTAISKLKPEDTPQE